MLQFYAEIHSEWKVTALYWFTDVEISPQDPRHSPINWTILQDKYPQSLGLLKELLIFLLTWFVLWHDGATDTSNALRLTDYVINWMVFRWSVLTRMTNDKSLELGWTHNYFSIWGIKFNRLTYKYYSVYKLQWYKL